MNVEKKEYQEEKYPTEKMQSFCRTKIVTRRNGKMLMNTEKLYFTLKCEQ